MGNFFGKMTEEVIEALPVSGDVNQSTLEHLALVISGGNVEEVQKLLRGGLEPQPESLTLALSRSSWSVELVKPLSAREQNRP